MSDALAQYDAETCHHTTLEDALADALREARIERNQAREALYALMSGEALRRQAERDEATAKERARCAGLAREWAAKYQEYHEPGPALGFESLAKRIEIAP